MKSWMPRPATCRSRRSRQGYKIESDRYLLLEDEELDNVALESTHTSTIEEFVRLGNRPHLSRRVF